MLGRHDDRIAGGTGRRRRRRVGVLGRIEEDDDDGGGDKGRDLECRAARAPRTARLGRGEEVLTAHA